MWLVKQRPVNFYSYSKEMHTTETIPGNWQRRHFNTDVQQRAEADMYCMFWIQYLK